MPKADYIKPGRISAFPTRGPFEGYQSNSAEDRPLDMFNNKYFKE